jgi:hypothetical protein
VKLLNLVSLGVDRDTRYGTIPEDFDGVCLMTDQLAMNLIRLEGDGAVEGMIGKDGRWGYLEKEGTLKNMEPSVVVVRKKVLHGHRIVCRDVKRDPLCTRRYTQM